TAPRARCAKVSSKQINTEVCTARSPNPNCTARVPGKTTFDWREIFEKRKPISQRQILAKNHQVPLHVAFHEFALRTNEKTAVEVICILRIIRTATRFGII